MGGLGRGRAGRTRVRRATEDVFGTIDKKGASTL